MVHVDVHLEHGTGNGGMPQSHGQLCNCKLQKQRRSGSSSFLGCIFYNLWITF
jgi:hypothetical protein